ncbi:hypothetical protein AK88_00944 [Plasmodium fragile]|uniref:Uncharacterized protein n=1 Tax=Plasmodium fragile TaxID=5857 RepID=A0A0D9QQE7_PLAFR|nr:uncharacterized protein AK88_00944 [Plasmodium fragile]KJP89284.1 hypothetical protein AK88_00944 [Plasmodium fragile]
MYSGNNSDKSDQTTQYHSEYEETEEIRDTYEIPPNPTMINLTGVHDQRPNILQQLGINNKTLRQILINMLVYVFAILISLQIWDYMSQRKCHYYKDLLLRLVRYQSHMNDANLD